MTSLFDGIFQLSEALPVNPLFSSSNKFKSAKVASVGPADINGGENTTADAPAAGKATKTAKRKAAQPAEKQASHTKHKRSKTVASSRSKHNPEAQGLPSKHDKAEPTKEPRPGKRKRLEAKSIVAVEASPAAVNEKRTEVLQETVDDSAIHQAAVQVQIALSCTAALREHSRRAHHRNTQPENLYFHISCDDICTPVTWVSYCRGLARRKRLQSSGGQSLWATCLQTSRKKCCRKSLASTFASLHAVCARTQFI